MGMIIPNIWKKNMFQTTNQKKKKYIYTVLSYRYLKGGTNCGW